MTSYELADSSSQFRRRTNGLLLSGIFAQVVTAVGALVTARVAGPADFGLIATGLAIIAISSDVIDFGTNTYWLRVVSAKIDEMPKALAFARLRLKVVSSLACALWVLGAVEVGGFHAKFTLLLLTPYLATFPISLQLSTLCRAVGQFRIVIIMTCLERVVFILVLSVYSLSDVSIMYLFAIGISTSTLMSSVMYALFLRKFASRSAVVGVRRPIRWLRRVYVRSLSLGLANISTDLNILETPVISIASSPYVSGQYSIAARVSGPLGLPAAALCNVLFPELARLDRITWRFLGRRCAPLLGLLLFVVICLISVASFLVSRVLGDSYGGQTAGALRIVCVMTFLGAINQVGYTVLQARHMERQTARMISGAVVLGIGLCAVGAAASGATLAAVGGLTAQLVLSISFFWTLKTRVIGVPVGSVG